MPNSSHPITIPVTNGSGGAYTNGQPVKEGKYVGIAVKQKAPAWNTPLSQYNQIADGEEYVLIRGGAVQVSGSFAFGDELYISDSNTLITDALSEEVQVVSVSATGGTFTVTVGGDTTASIAYNASAATFKTALEGTAYVGTGDVTVTKPSAGEWRVVFGGALANTNVATMTVDDSSLTGDTVTASVSTETQGAGALGTPFGRVVETPSSNRSVPAGKVVVDLAIKTNVTADTF